MADNICEKRDIVTRIKTERAGNKVREKKKQIKFKICEKRKKVSRSQVF